MGILYSMCWEDPDVLIRALDVKNNDNVLSITSGGENVFSLLLKNPRKIIAIDINKEQIYLTKLKSLAIQHLSFKEFVQFIGFEKCHNRLKIFNRIKIYLDKEELNYWVNNKKNIKSGVIHCGKLEKYLFKFRKFMLPFILSKSKRNEFLRIESLEKQKDFFDRKWNNWRFRFLFNLFFSKRGMSHGRKKDYFKYSEDRDLTSHYFERTKHGLTKIPIKSNFFMQYILTGTIPIPSENHAYLDPENFHKLKSKLPEIKFIHEDIYEFIKKSDNDSFSKFNLSDIFELKTQEEYEAILREIARVSKKNSKVCYWNNLVPRYEHQSVENIVPNKTLSARLSEKDRCHFYSRFIVENIKPNEE